MQDRDEELVALVARCAIKDQAALKRLFERVGPYLNAVAYRILRQDDAANEVLQEAFLQIWDNAATYRPHTAKALTWMTSILRYRALDRLDKERRLNNRFIVTDEQDVFDASGQQNSPEHEIAGTQMDGQIIGCLAQLNDKISASIKLAYIHGYSRDEIAQKFDTNVNTIKSWLRRGSERLKQCLETQMATSR
ncbi:MAG: sigma-70 family RNA polymerase sigma factor [Agarilytica sp.]